MLKYTVHIPRCKSENVTIFFNVTPIGNSGLRQPFGRKVIIRKNFCFERLKLKWNRLKLWESRNMRALGTPMTSASWTLSWLKIYRKLKWQPKVVGFWRPWLARTPDFASAVQTPPGLTRTLTPKLTILYSYLGLVIKCF